VGCTSTTDAQFPPQTVSIIIDRSSDLPKIISWMNMGHNLRSLSFGSESEDDFPLLTGLFHTYSDTLTELELKFGLGPFGVYTSLYEAGMPTFEQQNNPITLSRLLNLTRLTISASIRTFRDGMFVSSSIPSITRLAATSPSLKRLILRVTMNPWHTNVTAESDIWEPLVSLAEHPSLEHIELGIISVTSKKERRGRPPYIDVESSLMRVPELKKLCEDGFLSMKEAVE